MTKVAKTLTVLIVMGAMGLVSMVNGREISKELNTIGDNPRIEDNRAFLANKVVMNVDKSQLNEIQGSANIVKTIIGNGANSNTLINLVTNLDISEGCNLMDSQKILADNLIAKKMSIAKEMSITRQMITYNAVSETQAGNAALSKINIRLMTNA